MRDLVKDGSADFGLQFFVSEAHFEVGGTEDDDSIRKSAGVVGGPLGKRNAFVESQDVPLVIAWPLLDHNVEVIDLFHHPWRQALQGAVDYILELTTVHSGIQSRDRMIAGTGILTHPLTGD
jgi:hypothetical protein